MNLSGVVKVQVEISPAGTVTSAKALGGHPVFIDSALDAVKKWRFETAQSATQQTVEFGSVFALYLRNVGTGTVSAASGGRGEVRDGTMVGDVQVYQNDVDLGICTSTGHRWSLRAR